MDNSILIELDGIQSNLSVSIGMISVIADGLSAYTRHNALTGEYALRYADALSSVYDTLSGITTEFGGALVRARTDSQGVQKKENKNMDNPPALPTQTAVK